MRDKIFAIVFIIFFTVLLLFSQSEYYGMLINANKSYEAGDYEKAISYYSKILKKLKNGYLYYNIGTCYLRLNKIGYSLFYFSKAKYLIPLNKNLNKNLIIAESKVKDNIPKKNYIFYLNNLFFISKLLSIKILFYFSIFFLYLTIFFYIFKILKKKNIPLIISFILFLIFLSNFIWSYYSFNYLKFGYIIRDNVNVYDDFTENSKKIFTVNDGTGIYVLEKHGKFLYVMLPDRKTGWINKKFIIFNSDG